MAAFKLIFNNIDGEYKVLNYQGHVVWNADTPEECIKGAADFLGCNPEDIEVEL